MNHISGTAYQGTSDEEAYSQRLLELTIEATSFVAKDKVEGQIRQWLASVPWIVHDGHREFARALALELALISPSLMGTTAFDRLAREMKARSGEDIAAVARLRQSQPRIARLSATDFEDLATGERAVLSPKPAAGSVTDSVMFGRFLLRDDRAVAAGILLDLDHEALTVAQRFLRPDRRGLTNPLRCAEALYRFVVRSGAVSSGWRKPEPELPFRPATNPLDALAADWASLDREPGPEEVAPVKEFVGIHPLLNALISVGIARAAGAARLAAAYRRISGAIIEFMAVREAYGSSGFSLDHAADEVDAAIKRGRCGFETKALFNDLRERARLAVGKTQGASGDLDRLMQRIRGLRAKTVEQGCTEQEAMAAAEKVAELLDRYGLSLSELDLRKQRCEGIGIETSRKRRGPIDDCMGMIARFFDCRVWGETAENGTLRHIFFGLPGDVQAAVYLHDLIALAFATETAAFQRGEFYGPLDSGQRRSATNSFQVGLAQGIVGKLHTLRQARETVSNGRALVPVKQSIVDAELERLGLTLQRVNATRRTVFSDAFDAGREAGEKFEYRAGIEAGG